MHAHARTRRPRHPQGVHMRFNTMLDPTSPYAIGRQTCLALPNHSHTRKKGTYTTNIAHTRNQGAHTHTFSAHTDTHTLIRYTNERANRNTHCTHTQTHTIWASSTVTSAMGFVRCTANPSTPSLRKCDLWAAWRGCVCVWVGGCECGGGGMRTCVGK